MPSDLELSQIPRGNTCRGVNRAVIEYLIEMGGNYDGKSFLDIPCGDGALMKTLRYFFPKADVKGCDYRQPKHPMERDFEQVDASRPFSVFSGQQFDVLTSVSGVMEFDNTLQFFGQCKAHLKDDGLFLLTNDNIVTVRDRIAYMLLGKVMPYALFVSQQQHTWKVIPLHNLIRILQDAGFSIQKIQYVSIRAKDLLFLPFALILYPVQFLYMHFTKNAMPRRMRHTLYPFASLLYRHYIVICKKQTQSIESAGI
jgi:2-polyprenyl-3-methyl-5-hydroxy-6-metoxy-1,4-benzoquinol methylase